MKFEQLNLTGDPGDYAHSLQQLVGSEELSTAIKLFYTQNAKFNPRQLEYIVSTEASDHTLDVLLGIA